MKHKMSDEFELPIIPTVQLNSGILDKTGQRLHIGDMFPSQINAVCHAINNHDRLTAQVEELKAHLLKQQEWLAIDPEYTGSPLEVETNQLLTRIGEDNA